jgi:hypothetical protein
MMAEATQHGASVTEAEIRAGLRVAPASDNLRLRGDVVRGLQQGLIHGGHTLKAIPETVRLLVDKGIWRERVEPQTGQVVTFYSFEEFVTAPPLEGLGSDIRQLKHLCRDDPGALDAIDRATVGGHGGDRKSEQIKSNNVTLEEALKPQTGNANTYALRKLRKDRPDLHKQVLAEEKTPHAAMVEAGFRQRTLTIPKDLEGAARRLAKHFDPDELCAAMKGLS